MKPVAEIQIIAIIGNGLMGQGIAQVFARSGKTVKLIGRNPNSLERAMQAISTNFDAFVDRNHTTREEADAAIARISTTTDYNDAANADFVIEAVPAVRETQIEVFGRLDEICSSDVVLASTSGQPISLMIERMAHPERAIAAHFVYPAQLMPLVEICGGEKTSPEVIDWTCQLLESVGQTNAVMDKEVDGFIINRLQFAIMREAWSMWANGIASAEAIDASMRLTLGRRYSVTGPIESAELGGLDIIHMFGEFLFPSLDNITEPPEAVTALVREGNFGLKTGKGIYDWSKRDGAALLEKRADRLFEHMKEDATSSK
jgi:3-hydroxybutyryl-CoA dehydrogenase